MAEDAVRIEGLNTFIRTCRKAGADMKDFKEANQRTGSIVVGAGSAGAPRRSGALAASLRAAKQARAVVVRGGSAKVPYAGPIHWGWGRRNIPANPFLSRAARNTEPQWSEAYHRELQAIVDKVRGV